MAERSPIQIQHDRMKIADMYCRGLYQSQIAKEMGLSQQTISRDLGIVRELWRDRAIASFDQHVANQLAKIDNLERTYWEAWEKSQKPKRKERASTSVGGKYDIEKAGTEVELERDGNPNFLMGVERCIQKRIDLLGLKAPDMWERADWQREMRELGVDAGIEFEKMVQASQMIQEKRERELVEVLNG